MWSKDDAVRAVCGSVSSNMFSLMVAHGMECPAIHEHCLLTLPFTRLLARCFASLHASVHASCFAHLHTSCLAHGACFGWT